MAKVIGEFRKEGKPFTKNGKEFICNPEDKSFLQEAYKRASKLMEEWQEEDKREGGGVHLSVRDWKEEGIFFQDVYTGFETKKDNN